VNRPDLIIVGFGNGVLCVNALEAIRTIPPFKRAPENLLMFKEITRYSDVSVMTIIIDDPDYTSNDLYVLFYTTPTERQNEYVNQTVIEIEKRITAWFHGTLYLVDHTPWTTLCTIRKNMIDENDEPMEVALESVGPISSVFIARDEEMAVPLV
jgi:hypothetical protein